MAEMGARSSVKRKPQKEVGPRIDRIPEIRSKKADAQAWAKGLAEVIGALPEEWEAQLQEELGIRTDETIEQLHGDDPFSGLGPPPPDDDPYDFTEYDEDNPLHDEDDPHHFTSEWQKNELEAWEPNEDLDPVPDIIIDEFGHITIPKEDLLSKYLARIPEEVLSRSTPLQQQICAVQLLRSLAEKLRERLKDQLLGGQREFPRVSFTPFTQKEIMEIDDKHLRARLANSYIKTPYWGTPHLSAFLEKEVVKISTEWDEIMGEVRSRISKEDLEHPVKNKVLWEALMNRRSDVLKDNKEFRNKMKEAGIPLQKPRRDIFIATKKWVKDHAPEEVQRSKIPRIRETLQKSYGLFNTGQTKQCREQQYIPFVEDRITSVMNELGVSIRDEGGGGG